MRKFILSGTSRCRLYGETIIRDYLGWEFTDETKEGAIEQFKKRCRGVKNIKCIEKT